MASYFHSDNDDDLLFESEASSKCFSRQTAKRKKESNEPIQIPLKKLRSSNLRRFFPTDDDAIKLMSSTILADVKSHLMKKNVDQLHIFLTRLRKTIESMMKQKKFECATIFQETATKLLSLDLPELISACQLLQTQTFQKHLIEDNSRFDDLIEKNISETFVDVCRQIGAPKLRPDEISDIAEKYLRNGDVGVCVRLMIRMFGRFDTSSLVSFVRQRNFKSNICKLFEEEDFFFIVDELHFKLAKELVNENKNEFKETHFSHCYVAKHGVFSLEQLELCRFETFLNDERVQSLPDILTQAQKNAKIKDKNSLVDQFNLKIKCVPTDDIEELTKLSKQYKEALGLIQNKYKLSFNDLKEKQQFILSKRISSKTKLETPHKTKTSSNRFLKMHLPFEKCAVPLNYSEKDVVVLREVFMKCKWFNVPGTVVIDMWIDPKSSNSMHLVDTSSQRKIISSLINVPNTSSPKETIVFRPNDEFIRIMFHRLKHQVNINTFIGDERRSQYWVQMYYHVLVGNEDVYFIQDEYMFSRMQDFLKRQSFRRRRLFDFNFSLMAKGTKHIWIQCDSHECMSTSCSRSFGGELFFEPTDFFFFLITNASQREQKQDLFIITHENKTYTFKIIYEKNNNEIVFQNEIVFEQQKNQLENHIKMTKQRQAPNEESRNVALFMMKTELSQFKNIPSSEIEKTSNDIVKTFMENSRDNNELSQNIASVLCFFPFGRKIGSHFGLNPDVFFDLPIVSPEEFIKDFETLSKENKFNVAEMLQFERMSLIGQFFEFLHDASALTLRKKGRVKLGNKIRSLQALCSNRDDPVIVVPHVFYADNGHVYALELFQLISRFTQGDIINPHTGEPFRNDFVDKINLQYSDFDEDVVQKFDILQNLSDNLPLKQIKDNSAPLQKLLDDFITELNTVKEELTETFEVGSNCSMCRQELKYSPIVSALEDRKLKFCSFDCVDTFTWPEPNW
jgi:hypothetical protein